MNAFPCSISFGILLALVSCSRKSTDGGKQAAESERNATRRALEWNLKTLVGDYERQGGKNSKWDRFAREALTEYAKNAAGVKSEGQDRIAMIGHYTGRAVESGCEDPLIKYLYCRFVLSARGEDSAELARAYLAAAEGLRNSDYSPIRKFYAQMRAAELVPGRDQDPNALAQVFGLRSAAATYLGIALKDQSMPIPEVYAACHLLLQATGTHKLGLEIAYKAMEKPLFENWPDTTVAHLLQAQFYVEYAWRARGYGYANTVTKERWQQFRERLAVAERALEKAWTLDPKDPRIPTLMIRVEHGQGKSHERMELWFSRAMELNTNNYAACESKLLYLYPQWYGSRQSMLEFGRQCVSSDKWGGQVPLILWNVHQHFAKYAADEQVSKAYWKQPEVWPDIKASFEKFLKLNPAAIAWRHNYAWAAYACEQWKDLNEQLKLLGRVNYAYFGGYEAFEKMVQLAKEHAEPGGGVGP